MTKRHLLEWQTAIQTERVTSNSLREVWRRMLPAEIVTLVVAVLVGLAAWQRGPTALAPSVPVHVPTLAVALPLILLWALSPVVAHALSAPALRRALRLAADERDRAMRYALFHWRFFERFVGEATQWLAPDNYQEDSGADRRAVARRRRTSGCNCSASSARTTSACSRAAR